MNTKQIFRDLLFDTQYWVNNCLFIKKLSLTNIGYATFFFFLIPLSSLTAQEHHLQDAQDAIERKSILEAFLYTNKAKPILDADSDLDSFYQKITKYIVEVEEMISTIKEPSAKRLFYGLELDSYEEMIEVCAILYKKTNKKLYLKQAFKFTEKHRNLLVSNTLGFDGDVLSDSLKKIEGQYLSRISESEDSLNFEKKQHEIDESTIDRLEFQRDEYQDEYELFLKKNRKENRGEATLEYITIEALQRQALKNDENFVSYFYGKKSIFVFIINKKTEHFFKLKTTKTPEDIKNEIYSVLENLHSAKEKQAIRALYFLYKTIFKPIEKKLEGNKLQIVADGALSALPFDALLTKLPTNWDYNYKKLSYLVYQYQITFQHSATIFGTQRQDIIPVKNPNILLFAPNFENIIIDKKRLNNLEQSASLIEKLQKKWDGNYLINKEATLFNLEKYAEKYDILHFVTHTLVNDETPLDSKIILSEASKPLLLKDLYQMNLKMDLAVLGSCRTGSGRYQVGVGRVGMAYGFHLAGVSSLVYSLWEVDEFATNQLLLGFYDNLKVGMSKEKSLHQAKIQYLEKANESTADPYYWAGFVMQGKTAAFEQEHKKSWLLWFVFGFCCLLIIWQIWQSNKEN